MTDPTMSSDHWARVQELFHLALSRSQDDRAAFLTEECRGDEVLRQEVLALLDAHEDEGPLTKLDDDDFAMLDRVRSALVGRYSVVREVASGGMATVYLAEDLKHSRHVAIKVLRPDLTATIGADRFLREIEIAAGLQHPHILPLYDSGSASGLLYYVMPFVEGDTLWDRLSRSGSLPVRDALRIADNILSALEYAHRKGVVHRDIKPSNVLISTSGGHAMVADFGIARAVSAAVGEGLTVTGAAIGTPGYMPPEQAGGKAVGPATDVYAVGVVLYECLTGRRWSFDADPQEADWSGVPSAIEPVLKRALAWSQQKRWSDAASFSRALQAAEQRALPWRRAGWLAAGLAAGLVAIGVGARALLDRSSSGLPSVHRLAVLPFSVRGSEEYSYLGEGMVDLLSTKLDGAGTWRSVDPRLVLSMLTRHGGVREGGSVDPATGRRIAQRLDADLYILGSIVEVGGQLRLNASLYREEEGLDAVVQASAEGEPTDVLGLLDGMAAQLLAGQDETSDARLTQLALVTSSSLPALKSYLRGVRALRAQEYTEAAAAFDEALAFDSTFALAWYQRSVTADWLLRSDVAKESAERAVRYSDRLSDRDRRLLEALRTARRGEVAEADRLYRAILGIYPDDVEAWSQLGELLAHFGPQWRMGFEVSREPWERLAELQPDRAAAYVHLARLEASRRNFDALDRMARRVIQLVPEGDRTLEMRMLQAFVPDDGVGRDRVLAGMRRASEDVLAEVLWSATTFVRDPDAVATLLSVATDPSRSPDMRATGDAWRAYSEVGRGQWDRAMAALDSMAVLDSAEALEHRVLLSLIPGVPTDTAALQAYRDRLRDLDARAVPASSAPGDWFSANDEYHPHVRLFLLGLLNAVLGDDAAALGNVRALRGLAVPEGTGSLAPDLALGVRATLAWRAGRVEEVPSLMNEFRFEIWHQLATASPFHGQVYQRYLWALALEETGRFDEAIKWYNSFVDAGLYNRAFYGISRWRVGRIHEQEGDLEAARRDYEEFLSLFEDPDPRFQPAVDDARRRLQGLREGTG